MRTADMKTHWYSDNRVTGCHVINPTPKPPYSKGVGAMLVCNDPNAVSCHYCKQRLRAAGLLNMRGVYVRGWYERS